MDLVRISRGLAKLSIRRINVLYALIAFPVVLLLIIVSSSDSGQYGSNIPQEREKDTDPMFQMARLRNYKPAVAHDDSQFGRVSRINRVCENMDVPGTVKGLYVYNNISYCYNYKVASTYWIQIFRFLHHDVSYNVTKPSEISKYETHLVKTKNIRLHYLFSLRDHDEVLSSFRFMMTRDPYSRLWSVFVDKFILLDHYFWSRYSPEMRRSYLRPNATLKDDDDDDGEAKNHKIQCLDLSFTEFLNYVAKMGQHKPENLDDHFRPIHYGCNPCFYSPNYIGKVESMTNEKTPIIQKLGLNTTDDIHDFKSHVINEITMISDFEFKLWKRFRKSHVYCITDISLERKMIQAFIINGYLPENIWKRLHGLLPLGEERFKNKIISMFLNSSRTSSMMKQQREKIRKNAYRNVPLYILKNVRRLYMYDFALFGYDTSPEYIFGGRGP